LRARGWFNEHVKARSPLQDLHGRRISDLGVSVTGRRNFRCQ
jgi:hypothetical protein